MRNFSSCLQMKRMRKRVLHSMYALNRFCIFIGECLFSCLSSGHLPVAEKVSVYVKCITLSPSLECTLLNNIGSSQMQSVAQALP